MFVAAERNRQYDKGTTALIRSINRIITLIVSATIFIDPRNDYQFSVQIFPERKQTKNKTIVSIILFKIIRNAIAFLMWATVKFPDLLWTMISYY